MGERLTEDCRHNAYTSLAKWNIRGLDFELALDFVRRISRSRLGYERGPMPLTLHSDVLSRKALAAGFGREVGPVFTGG